MSKFILFCTIKVYFILIGVTQSINLSSYSDSLFMENDRDFNKVMINKLRFNMAYSCMNVEYIKIIFWKDGRSKDTAEKNETFLAKKCDFFRENVHWVVLSLCMRTPLLLLWAMHYIMRKMLIGSKRKGICHLLFFIFLEISSSLNQQRTIFDTLWKTQTDSILYSYLLNQK